MANITTQTIRVDLSTDKVIPSAFTHQNDTARTLVFDMYNGGMPYTMTGNTVKFAYKSPIVNGQYSVIAGASMASGTVSGNKVSVTLPVAYTQISGVGMLTMIITPTSGTVRPVNIRLVVQKSADGDDTVAGASDIPDRLKEVAEDYYSEYVTQDVANLDGTLKSADIKIYHQYSKNEAVEVLENQYWDSSFNVVSSNTVDTYIFKLESTGYVHSTQNSSVYLLDKDKNPVKYYGVLTSNGNTGGYSIEVAEYYPYIAFAMYKGGDSYFSHIYRRISPFVETSGFYPISFLETYDVRFLNGEIVGESSTQLEYESSGVLNVATGSQQELSGWHHAKTLKLKKGTKLSAMYNTCGINLRGITASGSVAFPSSTINRQYIVEQDIYGSISYQEGVKSVSKLPTIGTGLPHWENDAFTNGKDFIKFINVTPPDITYGNKWAGKTWYAYGTSISDIGTKEEYNSTGNIGDGNNGNKGTYPLMIDCLSGMIRHNGAIGSGGIVPSQPHGGNLKDSILSCPSDADLVTLEIGPNDPYVSALGEIGDTGNGTLLGNLYQCFDYLTNSVNGRIVLLLVQNGIYNNGAKYTAVSNNQKQWEVACDKMSELAKLFGIPVINASANAINYGKQEIGLTLIDHIHHNYVGGAIVGRYIWEQLYNIEPYCMFTEELI